MSGKPDKLDEKYAAEAGRVFLNGTQALVRMALLQKRRDRAAGLRTAGFVSGYRGSPLGTIDMEMTRAARFLAEHDVRFTPGVNEDLAATALWGTQQIHLQDRPEWDGVFGLWYGKGPGVDRTGDAFRHANLAGSAAQGGVLALAGDDHTCKSSTTSHQSEFALMDAMIPTLVPSTIAEMIEHGLLGWALSRYSGCWAAMKVTADLTDRSVSLEIPAAPLAIRLPEGFEMPPGGLSIRWPDTPQEQEARLHLHKIPAALAFARANRLDRRVLGTAGASFGIVTTGRAWLDVRQALSDLGIDESRAAEIGLAVYKVAMVWPLDAEGVREFADGLEEVLVVEDKRPLIETQLKEALYAMPADRRPRVSGKRDPSGAPLLKAHDELSPAEVAAAIVARLARTGRGVDLSAALRGQEAPVVVGGAGAVPKRTPYFCSGCPHNSSTKVPEGSRALAGIGCHWMSQAMERGTATYTQMGGEGASWIGTAPFVPTRHVFQNLGDGTYFHSGLLAIRAAVSAKVNVTYKILFNDAVAMTGGQRHDGTLTPQAIAWQIRAEGIQRIALVSEEPSRYAGGAGLPPYVTLHHRDELDALQRELRDVPGVSAMIYDQTCAAEKRRRRKRGQMPKPTRRVMINQEVCEGCGDCSKASNCLSVVPVETEFGRKRQIDQSSCNQDFSCVDGFCPSFVTIEGAVPKRIERPVDSAIAPNALPDAAVPALDRPYAMLVTGVGGSGVITIGAILGMAAHLEGKACSVLDQTGMAQKGGAVTSHVILAPSADSIAAPRIARDADLLLGCDPLVAAGADSIARLRPGRSRAVMNLHETVTGDFTRNPDHRIPASRLVAQVAGACGGAESVSAIDATATAVALLGDAIATNLFMLGFAWQKGLIPLSAASIEEAVRLNGAAVPMNLAAFAWGRTAAADAKAVEQARQARTARPAPAQEIATDLDEVIRRRASHLAAYQDERYARRYRALVERVAAAESAVTPGKTLLTEAVARGFHKLMAYKDEYEVARLYAEGGFLPELTERFEPGFRLTFHLAPPLLAERDRATGHLRKRAFGPWIVPAFRLLARLRRLRGTWLDPFGQTAERRGERALIALYEEAILSAIDGLTPQTMESALYLARLPMGVRGFGHVKERSMVEMRAALQTIHTGPEKGIQPAGTEFVSQV